MFVQNKSWMHISLKFILRYSFIHVVDYYDFITINIIKY